jgi:hypothetical protein
MAINLCTNPSFTTDLTGWSDWGSPTRTRDTGVFQSTPASQQIVKGAGDNGTIGDYVAGTVGQRFLYQVNGFGAGALELGYQVLDAGFGSLDFVFSGVTVALNAVTWTPVSFVFTIAAPTAAQHRIIVRDTGAAATFNLDDVFIGLSAGNPYARIRSQFELRPY